MSSIRDTVLGIIRKSIEEHSSGILISIRVSGDTNETYLTIEGDELVFKTTEFNDSSRCNAALIGFLSRALKIPSSRLDIIYGTRSSLKRVMIKDTKAEDIEVKLSRIIKLF
ncbi:MAG: DUF167 domain-containing protein [Desulfurococcaceae archaeon]